MGNAGRSAATLLAASVAMLLLSCSARDLLAQRAEALNDDQLCEVLRGTVDQLEGLAARRQRPDGIVGGGEGDDAMVGTQFPNATDPQTGKYLTFKASKWTSGYLAGIYLHAFALTGDERWAELGVAELAGLEDAADETESHKGSHLYDSSYVEALEAGVPLAETARWQRVIRTAADALVQRFDPKVGAIQSWNDKDDGEFEVIIDSMASLKLLWDAARTPGGKQEWEKIGLTHARTVARQHFRPDGSTYHVVRFKRGSGEVEDKSTHQGHSPSSTWARGQAWAIVGFTHVANASKDTEMLETAQRAADNFLKRLQESDDGVPPWDFDLPAGDEKVWRGKDTSAGAIAASGLLHLSSLVPEQSRKQTYREAGAALFAALADGYLGLQADPPLESLLANGTFHVPKKDGLDVGLIWGDYYFMDCLSLLLPSANATCAGL